MRYDLKKPCANCPFRTDCMKGWLGRGRAQEIADGLDDTRAQRGAGAQFACHKTTHGEVDEETGEYLDMGTEQHCAGALILCEKVGTPNIVHALMKKSGILDASKLKTDAPVFESVEAFVEHHDNARGYGYVNDLLDLPVGVDDDAPGEGGAQ